MLHIITNIKKWCLYAEALELCQAASAALAEPDVVLRAQLAAAVAMAATARGRRAEGGTFAPCRAGPMALGAAAAAGYRPSRSGRQQPWPRHEAATAPARAG